MLQISELIKEVLEQGYLMSLATVDQGGVWVSDVVYINEEFDIYWISDEGCRHSQAILENPAVAATITISNNGETDLGLQLEGVAEKLEGEREELFKRHLLKRGKDPSKAKGVLNPGRSWYKLTPKKIELIYEKFFGFEKKILEF